MIYKNKKNREFENTNPDFILFTVTPHKHYNSVFIVLTIPAFHEKKTKLKPGVLSEV